MADMHNGIQRINPEGMIKNPAFSQAVTTQGYGNTIYIGGQNSVNADREIVGNDIEAQTEQSMQNIQTALSGCNAGFEHLVKLTIYIVQGQNAVAAFQASQKFLGNANPPAITVVFVTGLVNPGFLIEIEAIAFIPI
jgi:enamine deaminase RidA (YjgF/YER057c/UK114 family)